MSDTDTAEKPAEATAPPAPAVEVDHDALHAALTRLSGIVGRVLVDVDRNSSELHRHVVDLRRAHAAARDLLHPPPPPNGPDGATVLYAHALTKDDEVWMESEWLVVESARVAVHHPPATEVVFRPLPHVNGIIRGPFMLDNRRPLAVIRREVEG